MYKQLLIIISELKMRRSKMSKENIDIKIELDTLAICNKNLYSTVNLLFKILYTLPVSLFYSQTPPFSLKKRIKIIESFRRWYIFIIYLQ